MSKSTRKFLRECAKQGWTFKVYYEDDFKAAYEGTQPDKAYEELYACSSATLRIYGKDKKPITTVYVVFNNKTVFDDFYDYTENNKNHREFEKFEQMLQEYTEERI